MSRRTLRPRVGQSCSNYVVRSYERSLRRLEDNLSVGYLYEQRTVGMPCPLEIGDWNIPPRKIPPGRFHPGCFPPGTFAPWIVWMETTLSALSGIYTSNGPWAMDPSRYTDKKIFHESCLIKPNLDCIFSFSIDLPLYEIPIMCKINRKSVITIEICFSCIKIQI